MKRFISHCPNCNGHLQIASFQCSSCGMELRHKFELSLFDTLSSEQYDFLISFLRNKGNLKNIQNELEISYPTAKKRLENLLLHLELSETADYGSMEELDMSQLTANRKSVKASEIIKAKLLDSGGRIIVHTARGLPCEIIAHSDGKSFVSKKLPIKPAYEYTVFDTIVDLLQSNGGRAKKGNGRNYKLGHPACDETTVVGAIAKNYAGKKDGESVYDPVFLLAAVLEWAGIAHNGRGELVLTQSYRNML